MTIYMLTDYKGQFGSKWNAEPYRSGMNVALLKTLLEEKNYKVKVLNFTEALTLKSGNKKGRLFLYTSSEDIGLHYKDYIEDVILGLQERGDTVVPDFKFLRANNNKVFMEILKSYLFDSDINNLKTGQYGVFEDVDLNELDFPVVIKESAGAMSRGVSLARDLKDFLVKGKKIARTKHLKMDIKDFLRAKKHIHYKPESLYRRKFITQQFIPDLQSDFKILIFGNRYYIFERPVRENDFRASGSGNKNYIYGSAVDYPEGIFDYAKRIFEQAKVPILSIDIAFDGNTFYLLEFQAIYFGTVGQFKANGYYTPKASEWEFHKEELRIEEVYADAVDFYLKTKKC
jgi:glutathione synthase/RimK-type ligase-like ATP-grasp enzyme